MQTKMVSYRLPKDLIRKLDRVYHNRRLEGRRTSKTELVEAALRSWLARQERQSPGITQVSG